MIAPPAFCTGSRNTAATVSGPARRICVSMSSAHARVQAGASAHQEQRNRLVLAARLPPGTSGSNGFRRAGMPVIDRAPIDVPW